MYMNNSLVLLLVVFSIFLENDLSTKLRIHGLYSLQRGIFPEKRGGITLNRERKEGNIVSVYIILIREGRIVKLYCILKE